MTAITPSSVRPADTESDLTLKKRVLQGLLQQIHGIASRAGAYTSAQSSVEAALVSRIGTLSGTFRVNLKNGFDAEIERARAVVQQLKDLASSLGHGSPADVALNGMVSDPWGELKTSSTVDSPYQRGLAQRSMALPDQVIIKKLSQKYKDMSAWSSRLDAALDTEGLGNGAQSVGRYLLACVLRATPARAAATALLQANDSLFELSLNLRTKRQPLLDSWRDPQDAPLTVYPRSSRTAGGPGARGLAQRLGMLGADEATIQRALGACTEAGNALQEDANAALAQSMLFELLDDGTKLKDSFPTRRAGSLAADPKGKTLPDRLVRTMRARLERAERRLSKLDPAGHRAVQDLLALMERTDAFDRSSRVDGTPWAQVAYLLAHHDELLELQSGCAGLCAAVDEALARLDHAPGSSRSGLTQAELDSLEAPRQRPGVPKQAKPRKPRKAAKPAPLDALPAVGATAEPAPPEASDLHHEPPASPPAPRIVETSDAGDEGDAGWTRVGGDRASNQGPAAEPAPSRSITLSALRANIVHATDGLLGSVAQEYDSSAPGLPMTAIVGELLARQGQERTVRVGAARVKTCLNDVDLSKLLTTCMHPGTFRRRHRSKLEAAALSAAYHVNKHAPGARVEAYLQRAFAAFDAHYAQEVTYRSDSPHQRAKVVRHPEAAGAYAWDHRLLWFA